MVLSGSPPEPAVDRSVEIVHVVAKTHLDLGFTDLASEVARRYLDDFFPRALEVAEALRERAGPARLVWTTGSWIVHQALADLDPTRRAAVAAGVERGDLAWHALPVTTHTEMMDADLVRSGLRIGAELDALFRPGEPTVAAKMTDVPGHTRSLVPLLAEAGVRFLHIGVNPAWPVPEVPPVFRWRSPDGSELVVAYQAGGYGGTVQLPGLTEVLTFLHADDNHGPPTVADVEANHARLQARFPGAEVRASTLDAFARAVVASSAVAELPVVIAEIGDPWLFGAGSDPVKVSAYRQLLRNRRAVRGRPEAGGEVAGRPGADPGPLVAVDRALLMVAEHTWGLDQKTWLPDSDRWDREGLASIRATSEGRRFESSWLEQRAYVDRAAEVLHATSADATGEPATIAASARSTFAWPLTADGRPAGGEAGFRPVEAGEVVGGAGWQVGVDLVDGSLRTLVHAPSGRTLADPDHPAGLLRYQSFDAADYERFYAGLTPTPEDEWWARWDNTKPGIDAVGDACSGMWAPEHVEAWHATHQAGSWHDLLVRARFDLDLRERLGAPSEVWARWWWSDQAALSGDDEIELTLWWVDKPANRLPEALWCSFVPTVAEPERWTMDKLGQEMSPLDVVRHGGRSLHGVGDGGLSYQGSDGSLRLRSDDAPLVAPGRPNLLDADPPVPDLAGGWHFLLADNCWGTNFPMWIEGPARFRFRLTA